MTCTENAAMTLPTMPLRGMVVFPQMMLHFDVGRAASARALDEAMTSGTPIFMLPQRDILAEEPQEKDLATVGTICNVCQLLRLPNGKVRAMVEGISRGRVKRFLQKQPYLQAEVEEISVPAEHRNSVRSEALIRTAYSIFEQYMELFEGARPEMMAAVLASDDPGYIADYIAQNIGARPEDKQKILEELDPVRRLRQMNQLLGREVEILRLGQALEGEAQSALESREREHLLREQLRVIRKELGENDNEWLEYAERLERALLPETVRERMEKELRRMEKQPFGSSELTVSRNYLDVVLELPWGIYTRERADVAAARRALDRDHYGLEKVKQRVLEFVAVRKLAPELKGQILCLVGPPGVGKTSIATSVAKALGRRLARVSLGGVHDEAEIRGHRKTYVGAMPGRIITAIRQAGSMNPVLVLDEIDKLGTDGRSDPGAALLEVLDSEQCGAFRDNFLEVPFDLSQVLFITTANTLDTIPRPLLDRMEVIELPSYTDEEKLRIAKQHLLPKAMKRHGLERGQLRLTDEACRRLIANYTRESGVRLLERELNRLCRKVAMAVAERGAKSVTVGRKNLAELLGPPKYHRAEETRTAQVGVVNGLAWTEVGGALLQVEANVMPGTGKVELTGNLGDVMKESARAAISYLRSRGDSLGLEPDFYKTKDIHIHFPEGAVPKDGPSAGIAIVTAIASALLCIPARADIAMTGEITLRGRVLPIGGLREKTMAALRYGIKTVLIPKANEKDLDEIDPNVRAALDLVPVEQVEEVLARGLERRPTPRRLSHGMELSMPENHPGLSQ